MRDGQGRILPDFIIVGAMRGGTTALAGLLGAHPQCFMPRVELHHFDREKNWRQGLDGYSRRFAGWAGQPVVGEKTPAYSYRPARMPPIPGRIRDALPEVRIVWSLRDPVDRAYSQFRQAVMSGDEALPFEQALVARQRPDWRAYRDRSVYVQQVEQFLEYFPRERLHFVKFERMIAEPRPVLCDLHAFLGLDVAQAADPARLGGTDRNAGGVPRSRLVARLGARLHWNRSHGFLAWLRRLNSARAGYPPMSPGTREELAAYFAPHNDALAALVGFDIAGWGAPRPRADAG
jgi:hypothetical protein